MQYRERKTRPLPWLERKQAIKHPWAHPFLAVDWVWEWLAYFLSNWAFLEALEYLSSLSVLIAVIFYFTESGDRLKQKHSQAWQVVNTAQGKGGSGGRIEALQELNADHVPLVGVDVSGAFLRNIALPKASLLRANFSAADVRESNFAGADLSLADLHSANFRQSNLRNVSLRDSNCEDADFFGADFSSADLSGSDLASADLRFADLQSIHWDQIKSITAANIYGVKNAPEGFVKWALQNGALQTPPPNQ